MRWRRAVWLVPLLLIALAGMPVNAQQERPNVLLIVADDLGRECLGAYGGTSYETPRIDRLAAEGARFTHCFSTPLCTPSRVQLMTGLYPFRTGWTRNLTSANRRIGTDVVEPRRPNIGQTFRAAGYATAVAGKWQLAELGKHPGHPGQWGFDEHCLWTWKYGGPRTPRYWNPSIVQDGALRDGLDDAFGPDVYTAFLMDFMSRNRARPFFAYYSMCLPHWAYVPTPRSLGDAVGVEPDDHGDPRHFGEMVAYMDELVGRLYDHLAAEGQLENTIVVFAADNGTSREITSDLGGRELAGGKALLTDNGIHVPLVVYWKDVLPAEGRVVEDLVDLSDFLPSLADLAGIELAGSAALDGRSFAPALRGEDHPAREWIFSQVGDRTAVRTQRWKLLGDALYDLRADPAEERPILPTADSAETAAVRAELREVLVGLGARAEEPPYALYATLLALFLGVVGAVVLAARRRRRAG